MLKNKVKVFDKWKAMDRIENAGVTKLYVIPAEDDEKYDIHLDDENYKKIKYDVVYYTNPRFDVEHPVDDMRSFFIAGYFKLDALIDQIIKSCYVKKDVDDFEDLLYPWLKSNQIIRYNTYMGRYTFKTIPIEFKDVS